MYIDPEVYKKEEIKDEAYRAWVDGYDLAIEDIDTALNNYVNELEGEELETFLKIQTEIASDFAGYLKDYFYGNRLEMIASILDGQEC
jgi:hypothetical protein